MGLLDIKFLVILGILFGLKQANAVSCYECGLRDSKCNDPFKASGVGTTECAGTCYKLRISSSKEQAAMRGCQTLVKSAAGTCKEDTLLGISGLVCFCQGNLCNYALPVGSSIMVTAAAMIINIILR